MELTKMSNKEQLFQKLTVKIGGNS